MNARQWRTYHREFSNDLLRLLGKYARDEMDKDEFIMTMVLVLLDDDERR